MKDIEHQILFSYILTFMDTYCVPCFQIIQQPKKKKKKSLITVALKLYQGEKTV